MYDIYKPRYTDKKSLGFLVKKNNECEQINEAC